ncbi:MAG: phenylalanine--tRNA ligase subunit alpha [Gammaproteobacteria bacterium]
MLAEGVALPTGESYEAALKEISQTQTLADLDSLRVHWLGRQGILTSAFKKLGELPPDVRKAEGQTLNDAREALESAIASQKAHLEAQDTKRRLARTAIDVTLPGRDAEIGSYHPLTLVQRTIEDWFSRLGFVVASGPEIEDDFHNFEALNIGRDHPARAMHDTFYVSGNELLRTHTSPVQIRALQQWGPPLRILAPGRVYRRDSDLTHTPMFHQVEGLVVDHDISWAHMKSLLSDFLRVFFDDAPAVRFRPSYFPFTEPSAEVDLACFFCRHQGCRICKNSGWIEVLGCGLVHPVVLQTTGVDSQQWSGFAFGMGIERLAMLKYGIRDIRWFYENDQRFLKPSWMNTMVNTEL